MFKRILILAVLLFLANASFSQTHYTTVRVSISYKNKLTRYHMTYDIGNSSTHPLNGKIEQLTEGIIKINEGNLNSLVLNTEVDMLTYFENHGWDLISVNEVKVIENELLQYLFKSE